MNTEVSETKKLECWDLACRFLRILLSAGLFQYYSVLYLIKIRRSIVFLLEADN